VRTPVCRIRSSCQRHDAKGLCPGTAQINHPRPQAGNGAHPPRSGTGAPAVHRLTTQTRSRDTVDLGQPPVIRLEPNVENAPLRSAAMTHRGAGCSTTTTAPWIRLSTPLRPGPPGTGCPATDFSWVRRWEAGRCDSADTAPGHASRHGIGTTTPTRDCKEEQDRRNLLVPQGAAAPSDSCPAAFSRDRH
jgi:hypothetical protein